ncbi:hypothetical protein DNU06_05720 [Putridiphycobacter roseus]|uniref:DUF748 domain-containing protein n=2 Tax=Putridiphycobacter roseus TaxID=2219161 RepID=A0A2W1N2N0_9FLAO|nr:hypothetical protein DNU06_05720 [Putridiphycobacter roseus]
MVEKMDGFILGMEFGFYEYKNEPKILKKYMKKLKTSLKKRKYLLIVLFLLIGLRVFLPYLIKDKLVAAINAVENYSCTISDVDLSIIRGAMVLQDFEIMLTDNEVTAPYLSVETADISIEWAAVIKGAIVGEIYLTAPIMHFSDGEEEGQQQAGDVSWVQPILDFIPLKINRFEMVNGKAEFVNEHSSPKVNLALTDIDFLATNLTNAEKQAGELPSEVSLKSAIYKDGRLEISGKMDILKEVPDMDLDGLIENVNLTALNDFTEAYAAFDFEKGVFSMATEIAMKDGEILGYVKPILEDVSVFESKEQGKWLNKFWQAFLGVSVELTENQRNDQSATKVPINGKVEKLDIGLLSTIGNLFKNAFIKAFEKHTDNTIDFDKLSKKQNDNTSFKDKVREIFND